MSKIGVPMKTTIFSFLFFVALISINAQAQSLPCEEPQGSEFKFIIKASSIHQERATETRVIHELSDKGAVVGKFVCDERADEEGLFGFADLDGSQINFEQAQDCESAVEEIEAKLAKGKVSIVFTADKILEIRN